MHLSRDLTTPPKSYLIRTKRSTKAWKLRIGRPMYGDTMAHFVGRDMRLDLPT
jgi:hypothetical protein